MILYKFTKKKDFQLSVEVKRKATTTKQCNRAHKIARKRCTTKQCTHCTAACNLVKVQKTKDYFVIVSMSPRDVHT